MKKIIKHVFLFFLIYVPFMMFFIYKMSSVNYDLLITYEGAILMGYSVILGLLIYLPISYLTDLIPDKSTKS